MIAPVAERLDQAWPAAGAHIARDLGKEPVDPDDVIPVDPVPIHPIGSSPHIEVFDRTGLAEGSCNRIHVVFDEADEGEIP